MTNEEEVEQQNQHIINVVLVKNNIVREQITRFVSGQINFVFDINNTFVLKIEGDWAEGVLSTQRDVMERLRAAGAKVPRILDAGEVLGRRYIFM